MKRSAFGFEAVILGMATFLYAQTAKTPTKPVLNPHPLPFTSQIKKTVVFITTTCADYPPPGRLANMTPPERLEVDKIFKMPPDQVLSLPQSDQELVSIRNSLGTGFIVAVPAPEAGKNQMFEYLVTNRHVVQPGIETGVPCKVIRIVLTMNSKEASSGGEDSAENVPISPSERWFYSSNPSVDLAVLPIAIDTNKWDIEAIPVDSFVTRQMISDKDVVEGDPVLFAGLFIQYHGLKTMEPIIRSGTIAMIPKDMIETTLGRPGSVYLAEAHVFGGNSGSPMFVDNNRFNNIISAPTYRLLGVVCGEFLEAADFSLKITTSYSGTVKANSDISMIVPAYNITEIINSSSLQRLRYESLQTLHH